MTAAELITHLRGVPPDALIVTRDHEVDVQCEVSGTAVVTDRSWLKGIGPETTVVELELI